MTKLRRRLLAAIAAAELGSITQVLEPAVISTDDKRNSLPPKSVETLMMVLHKPKMKAD